MLNSWGAVFIGLERNAELAEVILVAPKLLPVPTIEVTKNTH